MGRRSAAALRRSAQTRDARQVLRAQQSGDVIQTIRAKTNIMLRTRERQKQLELERARAERRYAEQLEAQQREHDRIEKGIITRRKRKREREQHRRLLQPFTTINNGSRTMCAWSNDTSPIVVEMERAPSTKAEMRAYVISCIWCLRRVARERAKLRFVFAALQEFERMSALELMRRPPLQGLCDELAQMYTRNVDAALKPGARIVGDDDEYAYFVCVRVPLVLDRCSN